jgi:hypothetical protein
MPIEESESIVVERNIAVAMRDGVTLATDVYRPAHGKWPTLIQRTPYGKSPFPDNFVSLTPTYAAEQGFAVVVQDTRGRGGSGGDFHPFDESADGYDTVEWASSQPWSNGRVGAYGSSYMGASTMQAAVAAPPSLEAFVALQASSDYFEGRSYWGGALELGALLSSSLSAMAVGSLIKITDPTDARALRVSQREVLDSLSRHPVHFPLRESLGGQTGAIGRLTPWFFDWLEHDEYDSYWREKSLEPRYGDVKASGLHVSSWFDAMLVGVLKNYAGLRHGAATSKARDDQQLIIGPWFHYALRGFSIDATRVGDVSFGTAAAINLDFIQLSWLAERLGGDVRSRRSSPVRLFVMGENYWRDEEDWPLSRAEIVPMFLTGGGRASAVSDDGELSFATPLATNSDNFEYDPSNPVPTVGGAHLLLSPLAVHGPADQQYIASRGDVATYASETLTKDLEVTGLVSAELWVTSSAPSTDFTARLVDVWPDGRGISVCDGIVRLPVGAVDPELPRPIVVELGATSQVFKAGHRIRLDVSSSNYPRFDPNPNTGLRSLNSPTFEIARQRIFHGPDLPSRLILSIVPA